MKERYLGYTTNWAQCVEYRSDEYDYGSNANSKLYTFVRENGGWNNWDMIEVERFEAIDGNDARKKERYWIEELKATLNNKLPTRSNKEYIEQHKEHLDECKKIYNETHKKEKAIIDKIYRENNKEKILERLLEKITCECGFLICRTNLKRHMKSQRHFDLMSKMS